MVVRCAVLILAICLHSLAQAQTAFQVMPSSDQTLTNIEFGKPLWLELSSAGATPSLATINLDELSKHFHIDKSLPITIEPRSQRQSWRLRLHAYSTGSKTIPSLLLAQSRSDPFSIEITDAIDPKTGKQIQVRAHLSHQQHRAAWVREQILVRYTFITDNTHSQLHVPSYTQPAMEIRPFKLEAQPVTEQQVQYSLGWTLHAIQAGAQRVQLPALQFMSDGVPTHMFYPPPLELDIQALPIYVPATMPVGQLQLHLPTTWHFTFNHSLADFPLVITGKGISVTQLPDLGNEIQSSAALRIYPTTNESQQAFTTEGITSQADYRIPYKPISQGLLSLPPIRLSYFDPDSATIKTLQQDAISVVSLSHWLTLLLAAILLFMLFRACALIYFVLKNKLRLYRCYYQAIGRLPKVTDAAQLRACMTLMTRAEALPANLSVNQWSSLILPKQIRQRQQLTSRLNQFFYKNSATSDVNVLVEELIHACKRRLPLLRWIH